MTEKDLRVNRHEPLGLTKGNENPHPHPYPLPDGEGISLPFKAGLYPHLTPWVSGAALGRE